ncbi:PAC2 family protein [Aeromicrobium wangtongii]|uniref:PAC2 family protein n=1 Tax=Aeromicrobium wangtongii TaxID=2969247 RepID=A0ABY5MDI6_9ACTN|nr:PAC2 family protein [Aeromicrobium wangtongii]MCD9197813.1 PAC2 family protein [Aeromicrobium wangtongii]MCL3819520.1 PAC2 family protein [Aeromicrobium wangtongii]UUP15294.1 PAC2 family protein [Aeromicrobium wangtongii]
MNWRSRRSQEQPRGGDGSGPILIHALDGFLGAGSATRLAANQLSTGRGELVHEFDLDEMFDYRARRPMMSFRDNHYTDYEAPTLQIVLERDVNGEPYFLLTGPEPDFLWERFIDEVHDVIEDNDIPLTLGLAAVPMGVPHTRPSMITAHGNRPELVDRQNLWSAQVTVPASAQSLLEYRLGQWGHDAAGYVVHVPHYLAQIEYPPAALALIDALVDRTGLNIDVEPLRVRQDDALKEIEEQIEEQGGASVLSGLEEQYDAFTRGAAQSLLASDEDLPSGDELADQFEQFLARQRKDDQS